ncbi:MAG TPA: CsgG/HfaB family protein [Armatimonadota bacterium]|nr:CsgG/HfaB family protein [Armatimonadota bacterium]
MLRGLYLSLLILLLTLPTLAQQDIMSQTADDMVKDLVTRAEARKVPAGETLVIAAFDNINCRGDALPRIFQERLITAFIMEEKGYFNIVERTQLDKAMKEFKMDQSGLTDPDMQKKIGKFLGANYILLGSISETQGLLTFEARIVAIESGQSKAATRKSINNTVTDPGSSPNGKPASTPQAKPAIDTTQNANSTGEGTYLGQLENGGLTPGSRFKQAWRECLNMPNACRFAVGDVLGTGKNALALTTFNKVFFQDTICHDLHLLQWDTNKFRTVSQAPASISAGKKSALTLTIMPRLILSKNSQGSLDAQYVLAHFQNLDSMPGTQVCAYTDDHWFDTGGFVFELLCPPPHWDTTIQLGPEELAWNDKEIRTNIQRYDNAGYYNIGDIDDDGQLEVVITTFNKDEKDPKTVTVTSGPIKVLTLSAAKKYTSPSTYGIVSTLWKPKGTKVPFIVATSNVMDATGKPTNDAYLYLLQWNENEYSEVWKSDRLGESILDMQVCDPKNEGDDGLVVMSKDKDKCYLTKFILQ